MNDQSARTIRACFIVAAFASAIACGDLDAGPGGPAPPTTAVPVTEGPSHRYLDRCGADDGPPLLVARYPIDPSLYAPGSHEGRFFWSDGNHLGEDMALAPGTPVHPIGPGRIVHYGPQNDGRGYGRLFVGVEHDLGTETTVVAGTAGMTAPTATRWLLSVYGHLRPSEVAGGTTLPWQVGDRVTADDVIGYVEDSSCPDGLADDPNGDGLPHLHEGIRLACLDAASAADPAPFRGYDARSGASFLLDFAAPNRAVWQLGLNRLPVGSLVKLRDDAKVWLVTDDGLIQWLATEDDLKSRRLYLDAGDPFGRVLVVDDLSCYAEGPPLDWPLTMRVTRCTTEAFGSGPATYLAVNDRGDKRRRLVPWEPSVRAFHALLRSWGFRYDEIVDDYEGCSWPKGDQLTMRQGTLLQESSWADYAIVAEDGLARRVDAELARQMGYDLGDGASSDVIRIPDGATPALTMGYGPDWTAADVHRCDRGSPKATTSKNNAGCDGPLVPSAGGGGTDAPASDAGCVPTNGGVETCDGKDDDCDGEIDEGFPLQWDMGNCGACGVSCVRPHSYVACLAGACVPQSCDPGWTDADGDWSDGCETPVATTPTDAGTQVPDAGPATPDAGGGGMAGNAGASDSDSGSAGGAGGGASSCGHAVRFRFSGYAGTWDFYGDAVPMTPVTGALDLAVPCVGGGWHVVNGQFPGDWLCEEWPLGTFSLPYGPLAVEVDGVSVPVQAWHDPNIPGGVGCNLRFCVGGGCP